MTVQFMYNFRSLSNKFPMMFWSLIFHISHPRLGYFFQGKNIIIKEKGNLKFSHSKMKRRETKTFSLL